MLLNLPYDILILILYELDIKSLLHIKKSNKYLLSLVNILGLEYSLRSWEDLIICSNERIPDSIIKKYYSILHVYSKSFLQYNNLSKEIYVLILNKYSKDKWICDYICKNYKIDDDVIDNYIVDWDIISEFQVKYWSNQEFDYYLTKYISLFDYYSILKYKMLTEEQLEYIIKNVPLISWITISKYQNLSNPFINKYKHKIFFRYLLLNKRKKTSNGTSSNILLYNNSMINV